jgi:activator of 2-hydroxyglutaryl-CoA dehydratase
MAAHALELEVEELGQVSLSAKGRAHVSAQCAVFGESEIVSHVNDGVDPADIVAGITYSVGASVASMVKRLSLEKEIVVTGGVAKNAGVIKALEEKLGVETVSIQLDSQIIGAVGAALLAQERGQG